MVSTIGFGIDIGGSGIKGAPVDLWTGELAAARVRIPTPERSTPELVGEVVTTLTKSFDIAGPIGVAVPTVLKNGVACTAANIDESWIGTDAASLLTACAGRPVTVLNDADAAGLAEVRYGVGHGEPGVVVMLTFGTGIGSALFHDGRLVPNTELGHIRLDGRDAEEYAAASVKDDLDLSWAEWADRVSRYLQEVERLVWPDLFILGGGVSKRADKWLSLLNCQTRVAGAQLRNNAGIVGAAMAAAERAAA